MTQLVRPHKPSNLYAFEPADSSTAGSYDVRQRPMLGRPDRIAAIRSISHLALQTMPALGRKSVTMCVYRVPVAGQNDPIVAITCISHPSTQATTSPQPAGPAPELQLDGVAGEDEGLEGGLDGDLARDCSAERVTLDTGLSLSAVHSVLRSACIDWSYP